MWEIEIRHDGLRKYRLIRGNNKYVIQQMAAAQQSVWDEMWRKKLEKEREAFEKEQNLRQKLSLIEAATEQTQKAIEAINEIENILKYTLSVNDTIDWESLKDKSLFLIPKPQLPFILSVPNPPKETDLKYKPRLGLLDELIYSRVIKRTNEAKDLFKRDFDLWLNQKEEITKNNTEAEKLYQEQLGQWKSGEQEFLKNQKEKNEIIEIRKEQYFNKLPDAIVDYCELVLSNSKYPDYFPQEFDINYISETKILVVNYSLPCPNFIPKIKEVRYIQSRGEFVNVYLSETFLDKLYDSMVYQITLRTIHELYESDVVNAVDSVVFNGWVRSIDKAVGKEINACILSVQANHQEFLSINLANVDPKICFKNLKGVGSSKLHSLAPITPLLNISREDKRFVSSYDVAHQLDESSNIAAMDWEDFEHLIRELFEKEFSQYGGEVKVTQASRDGGVDAIAFDPDPIRGGKIVIQAKRYTNTVGVSAVRDLYGTVVNEGATKGILVTTADYGPDAYEFAKGKPLTLLNGGNLLHLLEKHGHKATINLKEAKKILSEKENESNR